MLTIGQEVHCCPSVACAAGSITGGFADALPRECKVCSLCTATSLVELSLYLQSPGCFKNPSLPNMAAKVSLLTESSMMPT